MDFIIFAANPGAAGAFSALLPFLLIFVIFYFLLIMPQQRHRKKTQEMLANLKTGDRVVTSGGIYGTIVGFKNGVVDLQVANQVRVELARSAITGLASEESDGAEARRETAGKKK
jgi:preprotein translocase subunit YajC